MHDARAVEQHVDVAHLFADFLNRGFIGDVEYARPDAVLTLEFADRLGIQVGRPDLRPFARRRSGARGMPWPGGDERGFSCEASCHGRRRLYFAFP